jgi:3-dehydroquinate synthase
MKEIAPHILVGEGALSKLGSAIIFKNLSVFFLVDENTHKHCLPLVLKELPNLMNYEVLEVPAGEGSKTIDIAQNLWRALAELGANRNSVLINVGGGMITDLGGFVASTFMRGIAFCNVPTSLLGMVDAAIGGKTGIDFENAKNLIGTFCKAHTTLVEPSFLETLPERELISGFAEAYKHALLKGQPIFSKVMQAWEERDFETLIPEVMAVKAEIVDQDFHESDLRKTLNFGHTLGHVLESYFLDKGKPVLHGESIAAGMLMESWLSNLTGFLSDLELSMIEKDIRRIFPDLYWPEKDDAAILYWLQYDKKNEVGEQHYALLERVGYCTISHRIAIEQSAQAVAWYRNLVAGV